MTQANEKLSEKKCTPCEGQEDPLGKEQISEYLNNTPGWASTNEDTLIFREFGTKNFVAAVELIRKIADIAEEEQHHPDLHLTGYKKLRVELTTHAIGGLSENDFIMASKINDLSFKS